MKQFYPILISFLLFLSSCSEKPTLKDEDPNENASTTVQLDLNPEGRKFPILAYGAPYIHQAYIDMEECGFTLCIPEKQNLSKHLDASKGTGIKVICHVYFNMSGSEPSIRQWDRNFIFEHKFDEQVAMWSFCDEPIVNEKDWTVQNLKSATKSIRNLDSTHPIFLNWSAGTTEYWDLEMSEFFSYDHYPLKFYKYPIGEKDPYYCTYYGRTYVGWIYNNIKAYNVAKQNDTFWNGFANSITQDDNRPEVEERHLRLAQFVNLGCGAQMLSYYKYMNWYNSDGTLKPYGAKGYYDVNGSRAYSSTDGVQHGAPINNDGSHNPSWEMVRNVNKEVNSFAGLFLGMRLKTASVLNSDYNQLPSFNDFPSNIKISVPDDEQLFVSRFVNGGHEYVMCVNFWCKLDVHPTITIRKNVVRVLSDKEGEKVPEGTTDITLPVGDYLIWQVK